MRIETNALLRITSITNRTGQRLGHYIVDPAKDSPHRDKRGSQEQSPEADPQACKDDEATPSSGDSIEPIEQASAPHMHITA